MTPQAKALAFANLNKVCRIGTHLFHFAEYVNAMRGWGRGLRNAVGHWYVDRGADDLAHQAVKYQQRDGWSHGDLLRLAHPKAPSAQHEAVFRWMLAGADSLGEREVKRKVRGEDRVAKYGAVGELPKLIEAFEQAKRASSAGEIVKLINEFDLPREAIPTQWLNEVVVWEALLERMPMTAMIRNLGKMTSLGLLKPFSEAKRLDRPQAARRDGAQACAHPPAGGACGAEDLRPRPRRQGCAQVVAGVGGGGRPGRSVLRDVPERGTVRQAGAARARRERFDGRLDDRGFVHLGPRSERGDGADHGGNRTGMRDHRVLGCGSGGYGGMHGGGESGITRVNLSPRMRLADVIKRIEAIPMGGTDCALPMVWARSQQAERVGASSPTRTAKRGRATSTRPRPCASIATSSSATRRRSLWA